MATRTDFDETWDADGNLVESVSRIVQDYVRPEMITSLDQVANLSSLRSWVRDVLLPNLRLKDE